MEQDFVGTEGEECDSKLRVAGTTRAACSWTGPDTPRLSVRAEAS
jgi:hypothetical protein